MPAQSLLQFLELRVRGLWRSADLSGIRLSSQLEIPAPAYHKQIASNLDQRPMDRKLKPWGRGSRTRMGGNCRHHRGHVPASEREDH